MVFFMENYNSRVSLTRGLLYEDIIRPYLFYYETYTLTYGTFIIELYYAEGFPQLQ